jgi:hypothetical protein
MIWHVLCCLGAVVRIPFLAMLALTACGGESSRAGTSAVAGGDAAVNANGGGIAAGGGGAGVGEIGGTGAVSGQGGEAQSSPIGIHCGEARPFINAATGLESCSNGYVRRSGPANCPSTVPRAAAVDSYNATFDMCRLDSACPQVAASPYRHCGVRYGGSAHVCVDGCVQDTDCTTGMVCLCGDPVGRCVPATCNSGADCEPGFDCATYQADPPGCFSTGFSCLSLSDACVSDADCSVAGFVNPRLCGAFDGKRTCTVAQCFMP